MYFTKLREMTRKDTRLTLILSGGLLIQLIVCITAIGIYHPDQHFQIVEFSSHQLHKANAAANVWEFSAQIRSTFQVYLFSGWYEVCSWLGIYDPYTQMELLRIGFGLTLFIFFNGITLFYFRDGDRRILYLVLLLLNFTWILPYTRTLYSSEMLSSLLFFGAMFWHENGRRQWWLAILTGFLFALAFYARFQTAFAMLGFLVWMVWPAKRWKQVWLLALGFLVGAGLNTVLDYWFYHQWVFTPYAYYRVNILEGKAASMGTSSFLVYIGVLVAMVLTPPFSIFLLFAGFRTSVLKKYGQPLVFSVICFILGHCLVAHKEERFLFPIVNVLPIIIGWGLPGLIEWLRRQRKGVRGSMRGIMWFSVGLNVFLLTVLLFTPYSQSIYFTWELKKNFQGTTATIYSVGHTPFETGYHLPFVFYERGVSNLQFRTVENDSLAKIPGNAAYVSATYDELEGRQELLDRLGYKKVLYSSRLLWSINKLLSRIGMNSINDIWVLYQKK